MKIDYFLSIDDAKIRYPNIQIKDDKIKTINYKGKTYTYFGKAFESDKNLSQNLEKIKIYVLNKVEDIQKQVILKPPQTTINKDIESFNFNYLPDEIKKLILQILNLEDFLNFSIVDKKHLQLIKENFKPKILQIYLEYEAFKAWGLVCQLEKKLEDSEEAFCTITSSLMKSFPSRFKKTIEDLIDRDDTLARNLNPIILVLAKYAEKHPYFFSLIEKIVEKIQSNPDSLIFILRAFIQIDPEYAHELIEQIGSQELKFRFLPDLAAKLFLKDQKKTFEILSNNDDSIQEAAIKLIINECQNLDREKVMDFIQQIKDFIANKNLSKNEWILHYIVMAYVSIHEYDKAFETMHEIEDGEVIHFSKIMILLNKFNKFPEEASIVDEIEKCLPKISQDQLSEVMRLILPHLSKTNFVAEKLKNLTRSIFDSEEWKKNTDEWSLYIRAKIFLPFDLIKAKEIADLMSASVYKIYLFLEIAEKYKSINKDLATQVLNEAFLMIDQVKEDHLDLRNERDKKSDDIKALALVARHYAPVDLEKSKILIEKAMKKVVETGFLKNSEENHRYDELDIIPLLAEVLIDIYPEDKKRASHLIKNICKPDVFEERWTLQKVNLLFNLSRKLGMDLSERLQVMPVWFAELRFK